MITSAVWKCQYPQDHKWHGIFHSELGFHERKWPKLACVWTFPSTQALSWRSSLEVLKEESWWQRSTPQTIGCVSTSLCSRIPARELPLDRVNLEISLEPLLCTKMQGIFSTLKPFPENRFLILCLNSLFTEPTRNLWSNGIKRLNVKPLVLSL